MYTDNIVLVCTDGLFGAVEIKFYMYSFFYNTPIKNATNLNS